MARLEWHLDHPSPNQPKKKKKKKSQSWTPSDSGSAHAIYHISVEKTIYGNMITILIT